MNFSDIVGTRLADATFKSFSVGSDKWTEAKTQYREAVWQYVRKMCREGLDGTNLILMGPAGTGKDHMAVVVARYALGQRMTICWKKGSLLFEEASQRQRRGDDRIPEIVLQSDLLFLSDPEPTVRADKNQERLFLDIVDARYLAKKPIIVTSNCLSRKYMASLLGDRAVDRLFDGAAWEVTNWPSHRLE